MYKYAMAAITTLALNTVSLGLQPCLFDAVDNHYASVKDVTDYKPREFLKNYLDRSCMEEKAIINFKCLKFIPKEDQTEVCYAEVTQGYLFVSRDYLDNVNILFSRWD